MSIFITTAIILSSIGLVLSYSGFTDFEDFDSGCGCHGFENYTDTGDGLIEFTTFPETVALGEKFTITLQVKDFDPASDDTIAVVFPDLYGHNSYFSFDPLYINNVDIDSNGDSSSLDFEVTAPFIANSFTLIAYGIYVDGTENSYYVTGSLEISVADSGPTKIQSGPIFINNTDSNFNWSKTADENEWLTGNGTWGNPYIIDNVVVNGKKLMDAIKIVNSDVPFIIRNCKIINSSRSLPGGIDAGIKLINVKNGTITNNDIYDNECGISINEENSGAECSNNTISGNNIHHNVGDSVNDGIGVYLCGEGDGVDDPKTNNNTIIGNNIFSNGEAGIRIGGVDGESKYNEISKNNITDNGEDGIQIRNSFNNSILENNIIGNGANGILSQFGEYYTISENYIFNNADNGIEFYRNCDNNIIFQNLLLNNIMRGININDLSGSTGNDNKDNTIYYNSFIGNKDSHARDMSDSDNEWDNGIIGNYWDDYVGVDADDDGIGDTSYAIYLNEVDTKPIYESPNNNGSKIHIDGNGIYADDWGKTAFLKWWCSGSGTSLNPYVVKDLIIDGENSGSGILIGNSSVYYTIENNKVYNSEEGIYLSNISNGLLTNNDFSSNDYGIYLENCNDTTITGNYIRNNNKYGVNVSDESNFDNIFYDNSFIGNVINHAYDGGTSTLWNLTLGNYWDDYGNLGGEDADDDGVGDTSYDNIDGGPSTDYVPIWWDAPVISVTLITDDSTPPSFNVIVSRAVPYTLWYIVGSQLMEYEFTGETVSIEQDAWDLAPSGDVIIHFYAEDSRSYIGNNDTTVIKESTPTPPPPRPPTIIEEESSDDSDDEEDPDDLFNSEISLFVITISYISGLSSAGVFIVRRTIHHKKRK